MHGKFGNLAGVRSQVVMCNFDDQATLGMVGTGAPALSSGTSWCVGIVEVLSCLATDGFQTRLGLCSVDESTTHGTCLLHGRVLNCCSIMRAAGWAPVVHSYTVDLGLRNCAADSTALLQTCCVCIIHQVGRRSY